MDGYLQNIPGRYNSMWNVQPEDEYIRRVNRWPKKYRRELLAVHDNLDTFLRALNEGAKLEQAKFGFIHSEPRGVLAIDQKGGGPSLKIPQSNPTVYLSRQHNSARPPYYARRQGLTTSGH